MRLHALFPYFVIGVLVTSNLPATLLALVASTPGGPSLGHGSFSHTSSPIVHRSAAFSPWVNHPGPVGKAPPRNALVDAPCDSAANAEVESAFDASRSILYNAWIGCGGIGFSRSVDGGFSFQPAQTVPGSNLGSSWDPSIALSPNGTVYVGYMLNNGSGDAPMLSWSWDRGVSFANFSFAFLPNGREFSDRDFIAVAPNGTVYLTWDYSPNASLDTIGCATGASCYFTAGEYNILLVSSSSGGRNWSSPSPVSPGYPAGGAPCGPLLISPDGSVNVLYEGYNVTNAMTHLLGAGKNYFTKSSDGGAHFSAPVAVSNLTFPTTDWWINGAIAQDQSGTLYATFDARLGSNDTAYVSVSRTSGTSWANPVRLNPDANSAPHIMAEAAGGGTGTAYLAWMSNNSSGGWSTYEAVLSANGTVLSPPIVLSNQFGANGYWVGDTIGVSYLGGGHVAVSWTYGVTLNGTLASQIFSATVGLPLPGPPGMPRLATGAGNVTANWSRPTTGGPVQAYQVDWGVEGQHAFNITVDSSVTSTLISGLFPGPHYVIEVAALNTQGIGPFSAPARVTLTAWGFVSGKVTPVGANLSLDGVNLTTDGQGSYSANTTFGAHVILAQAAGYFPGSQAVNLPWNGSASVNFTLLPEPGSFIGRVVPSTAGVIWDGRPLTLGFGGTFHLLGAGGSSHTLNVSAAGYVSFGRNITIPRNATLWLNVTLVVANGTFEFMVNPRTAELRVGGAKVPVGSSGRVNLSRAPGVYAVEATASGYLPFFANYSIGSSPEAVPVNLTPVPPPSGAGDASRFLQHPPAWFYPVLLGAVVVILLAVVLLARRRPPEPPVEEGPPEPETLYPEKYSGPTDPVEGGGPTE